MRLLQGLHYTRMRIITWPKELNGRGMDDRNVSALAWEPGSDADEMWIALTEFGHSQREAEQPVREKEIA